MPGGHIPDLLKVARRFGMCQHCQFVQAGYPLLCSACAQRSIEAAQPPRCDICDRPVTTAEGCKNPTCGMGEANRGYTRSWSIAMRTGVLKDKLNDYKFEDKTGWALIFGRILVGYLEEHRERFSQMDLIIPSPTYLGDGADRKWDHIGTILERAQVEQLPPPWPFLVGGAPVIRKVSETPSMSTLTTYAERKANAEGVLRDSLDVPDASRVVGRSLLVFDDVYTDGLTLREVARALRAAGATAVFGLTLMRQPERTRR